MLKQFRADRAEHEKVLALGLTEVAAELRLIEAVDLVSYIHTGRFGNVRSLVNSSTEMYFKPGTMTFRHSGRVRLSWNGEPSVVLDMKFRDPAVDVYFQLLLEAEEAGVEIDYIAFSHRPPDAEGDTRRLIDALANARFSPLAINRVGIPGKV
jgi:hypothetical protein